MKLMVSPEPALLTALRNDPAPESFVLVTVKVAAEDPAAKKRGIMVPRVSLSRKFQNFDTWSTPFNVTSRGQASWSVGAAGEFHLSAGSTTF